MLIKGIGSLKFCAYVGQESREDESSEVGGLEAHKLAEQLQMSTGERFRAPSPPMFGQPSRTDKSRILELLKRRNEKRKIIKLLEKEDINSAAANSSAKASVVAQVERALKKVLQQEIQSLYQEVKSIIYSGNRNQPLELDPADDGDGLEQQEQQNGTAAVRRDRWPMSKPLRSNDIGSVVDDAEDAALETSDDAVEELRRGLNATVMDGIADDRGTIDHNHPNDTSTSDESSFSSSEEAMLHCRGVLVSQPLVPDGTCSNASDPSHNVVSYQVVDDGYYYFIFSSANEKVRPPLIE